MPQDENIKNLNIILGAMSKDHLGKADAFKVFKKMLEMVKMIQDRNTKEIASIKQALETFNNNLKENTGNDIKGLKSEVNRLVIEKLNNIDILHKGKVNELDDKMANIRDGKDADEKMILTKVLGKIKIPKIDELKKDLPKMSLEIRDAIELLDGEERFDIGAIRGLRSILRRLEEKPLGGKSGGGFSYIAMSRHIIDLYTPTGDINSVNKEFVLTRTPNPTSSLKVFLQGQLQDLTTCYTLDNKTITFVDAPITGNTVKCEHRI